MCKIDIDVLTKMIEPRRRNEYVAHVLDLDKWEYGFKIEAIEDALIESDLDLLIGTKNVAIVHDKKNDRLFSVPVKLVSMHLVPHYDFNGIRYLG